MFFMRESKGSWLRQVQSLPLPQADDIYDALQVDGIRNRNRCSCIKSCEFCLPNPQSEPSDPPARKSRKRKRVLTCWRDRQDSHGRTRCGHCENYAKRQRAAEARQLVISSQPVINTNLEPTAAAVEPAIHQDGAGGGAACALCVLQAEAMVAPASSSSDAAVALPPSPPPRCAAATVCTVSAAAACGEPPGEPLGKPEPTTRSSPAADVSGAAAAASAAFAAATAAVPARVISSQPVINTNLEPTAAAVEPAIHQDGAGGAGGPVEVDPPIAMVAEPTHAHPRSPTPTLSQCVRAYVTKLPRRCR